MEVEKEILTSAPSLAAMKLVCCCSRAKIAAPKSLTVVGNNTCLMSPLAAAAESSA